jgi:3-isopropylmalate/(R)-2-methylmalate dehydratase large subunit
MPRHTDHLRVTRGKGVIARYFCEAGHSMFVAFRWRYCGPGQRSIATSDRNFEGRQGPASRSHLASPAIAGCITNALRMSS